MKHAHSEIPVLVALLPAALAAPTVTVHLPPTAGGVVEVRPYVAADAWTGPPVVTVPVTGDGVSLVLPRVDAATRFAVAVRGADTRIAGTVLAWDPAAGWSLRDEAGGVRPLEAGIVIGE
jgi:hypothetical protein